MFPNLQRPELEVRIPSWNPPTGFGWSVSSSNIVVLDCSVICYALVHSNFYGCSLSKAAGYLLLGRSLERGTDLFCCWSAVPFVLAAVRILGTNALTNGFYWTKPEQSNSSVSQAETEQREAKWMGPLQAEVFTGPEGKHCGTYHFCIGLMSMRAVACQEQKALWR